MLLTRVLEIFFPTLFFFTPRTCRTNISSLYHFQNEQVLRQTNTSARARVKVTGITGFILKFDVKLSPVQKHIDAWASLWSLFMEYSNVTIQGEMNEIIVSSHFFYSCMWFYYWIKWLSSNPQVVN